MRRSWLQALLCVGLSACTGVVSMPDASEDAGATDAGTPDAGTPDAGTPDAGTPDAGTPDAGTPDAGRPDAGTPDAGTPDAGRVACPATASFCESFETGLESARWQINGSSAAFTVDTTTPAADGTSSLHLAYGAPYGRTGTQTVQLKTPVAAPNDRIYLRTYLRFGNLGLPGAHPAFIYVADNEGREQAFGSIINDFALLAWTPGGLDNARIWYEGGGNWHPGVENGDATPTSENGLTAQSWFCVELMFFGDHQGAGDTQHPNEQTKVWINGVEIPQLAASDALWRQELGQDPPEHWSPLYDNARWRFGVESFGPTNVALDLWFDALVISTLPIGCL
ncbi:MAG: hypothetical protein Q8L48_39785 [Archangium sp.]|nr:hypothetical protein [Archangium sp.]